jgi:hypothetical protein
MRFLKATLLNGDVIVGEFSKLERVGKYVTEVFQGYKPFNVWQTISDTLPSGEKALQRTRTMIAGSQILSIEEVDANGAPVVEVARGPRGRWTVPATNTVEGLVAGTIYPKHRDDRRTGREYVIVRAAGEGEGAENELRYFIGDSAVTEVRPEPADAEDDVVESDFDNDDDRDDGDDLD